MKNVRTYLNTLDMLRIVFDMIFIILSIWSFYSNPLLAIIAIVAFIVVIFKTTIYQRDMAPFYLDAFIDFLNHVNASLGFGMGFDSAIVALSKTLSDDLSHSSKAIKGLSHAISLGVQDETFFEMLVTFFPIPEAHLYARMIKLSKKTGASATSITNSVIEKLYMKFKVNTEIAMILYQKKLEQTILCLAPMLIILFIKSSSPGYMDILYETTLGRIVMTAAFALILIMKVISEKLVRFEV